MHAIFLTHYFHEFLSVTLAIKLSLKRFLCVSFSLLTYKTIFEKVTVNRIYTFYLKQFENGPLQPVDSTATFHLESHMHGQVKMTSEG